MNNNPFAIIIGQMALNPAFRALAAKLQEQAAFELSHNDLCKWLSDACNDIGRDSGTWCYMVDFIGDAESGDVIVSHGGDLCRAPYEIRNVNGKMTATVDMEASVDVLPRTVYEPEADEADHYAGMESTRALYTEMPFYERFISKKSRDEAPSGSFAGKGKSFPILKPGDIMAAVRSLGRAGPDNYDTGTIKRNIIKIAKAKGWTSSLPSSWTDDGDSKESADLELTGDVIPLKEGAVGQDGTVYLKLIAPGRGTSGYYPEEVLERDGPKVFKAGTKNYWNHQTEAEEAARPEGDLRDLASVLTEDAHYEENGPAGPGLYAKAEVQPPFRGPVDSLAKHIGMSIRANGKAREGKAPDGQTGPIIEQLTKGISVDYVTVAGAGGKILQLFEAARTATRPAAAGIPTQEADAMDAAELKKLNERLDALERENRKLKERAAIGDAGTIVAAYFATVRVGEAVQKRVTTRVLAGAIPMTDAGEIDKVKLTALTETETKDEMSYLSEVSGRQIVTGMGQAPVAEMSEADRVKESERIAEELKANAPAYGIRTKEGADILAHGRSAFRINFNSADRMPMKAGVGAED